jgi:hypothetical protein
METLQVSLQRDVVAGETTLGAPDSLEVVVRRSLENDARLDETHLPVRLRRRCPA